MGGGRQRRREQEGDVQASFAQPATRAPERAVSALDGELTNVLCPEGTGNVAERAPALAAITAACTMPAGRDGG